MKYYAYIYFDTSRSNEPIYVGKGSGRRSTYHLKRKKKKHPFIQRLELMERAGISPLIQHIDAFDEECAYEMEMEFIAFFGRKDLGKGPLLNLTDGGGKNAGGRLSEEHRKKIGDAHRGRILTEEQKEKVSKSVSAYLRENKRIWSQETKEKISKKLQGHVFSAETKAKLKEAQRKRRERERLTADTESTIL